MEDAWKKITDHAPVIDETDAPDLPPNGDVTARTDLPEIDVPDGFTLTRDERGVRLMPLD